MCPPILHNLGLYKYLILHKLDSMSSLKHQRFGNPTAPQAQSPKSLPLWQVPQWFKRKLHTQHFIPGAFSPFEKSPVKSGKPTPRSVPGLRRRPLPPSKSCLSALELQAFNGFFWQKSTPLHWKNSTLMESWLVKVPGSLRIMVYEIIPIITGVVLNPQKTSQPTMGPFSWLKWILGIHGTDWHIYLHPLIP